VLAREFSLASSSVSFDRDFTKLAKPGRVSPLAMERKIRLIKVDFKSLLKLACLSFQTFKHMAYCTYLLTPLHLGVAV